MRNIFSSTGISSIIAELTNTTTVMHARLVENVTPFNNALQMPDGACSLNVATDTGSVARDGSVSKGEMIACEIAGRVLRCVLRSVHASRNGQSRPQPPASLRLGPPAGSKLHSFLVSGG